MTNHPFADTTQGRIALRLLVVAGLRRWKSGGGGDPTMTPSEWAELLLSRLSCLQAATVVLRVMFGVKDKRATELLGYNGRGACFMQWKAAMRALRDSATIRRMVADYETHAEARSRRPMKGHGKGNTKAKPVARM